MRKSLARTLRRYLWPAALILFGLIVVMTVEPLREHWAILMPSWVGFGVLLAVVITLQQNELRVLDRSLTEAAKAQQSLQARLDQINRENDENTRRLEIVLSLNRKLVEAKDEQSLMESALEMLNQFTGALGCSFVPVDEWEQPLPPFTAGKLPEPVLKAWALHLSGSMLQERCGNCEVLQSTAGGCPLHPESVGNSMRVYCIPLMGKANQDPLRRIGILNLYLPPNRVLDNETRIFIEGLLQEIALANETIRLREQELSTLRQVQMLHAPETTLSDILSGMFDNLRQALEVEFVLLRLRPLQDERLSRLNLQRGDIRLLSEDEIDNLFNQSLTGKNLRSQPGAMVSWLAFPMRLPEGPVLGMLLIGSNQPQEFQPRHEAILQTIAAQAALLVENERMLRSLEYKAVIQERNRLAREIHDGLAQTLAFLKLQAVQMQTYLDKGDFSRLGQVLKDNYQALAEAYLDTRQSIDNLRISPREDLEIWLEQVASDFETTSGLLVERLIQPVSVRWRRVLSPEIQAQMVRIVQETLNNVRKHARAHQVKIALFEWQGDLVLEIKDDGRGFDSDDVPEVSQHGLRGIRERAELIGAEFQIISQARQGTVVRLVFPAYMKEGVH